MDLLHPFRFPQPLLSEKSHGVQANYIHLEDLEQIGSLVDIEKTLIVGNNQRVFQKKYEVIPKDRYYHNPYVNRMWPKIETFVLKKFVPLKLS